MVILTANITEVCVFKLRGNKPFYLLLHRSEKEKIYPNVWQFVTGSIHPGEKAFAAAIRELKEETGLLPITCWLVPFTFSFFDAKRNTMNLAPFFAVKVGSSAEIVLSVEHDLARWFSYKSARAKLAWPEWREGLRIVHEYIVAGGETAVLSKLN